ncbi:MAG: ABC transporter ATP-binding protein [Pseudomonadota bacterium]
MTLKLENVAKTFPDGTRALLTTDLEVGAGEIISLLGPSGCGKTTLLRIIGGLENPDEGGRVYFDGQDVTDLPVEQRRIGMVFQSYALFPNMNVRRNIGYGLKMLKVAQQEIDARVSEVIEMCHLGGFEERSVSALSGGQRQRVALARAVAPRPRILLLDEPLSALDAALRDRLRDELATLLRRFEITAVFVTHDQTEALAIADRVAVMSQGMVQQIAPPEVLYRHPASDFVAEFVGDAQALRGATTKDQLKLPGGTQALPADGEGCTAFVRSENVTLDPSGSLKGKVASVVFLGTHYRIGLEQVSDGILFAHHSGPAPEIGSEQAVRIDPANVMLLKQTGLAQ